MNQTDPTTGAVVAPAPQRRFRLPGALQARDFRRFWVGETVSLFGDQATQIALPLVGVLALNASAAQMGYLGAALLFPNLLFSLHAGALVDRRGRRREMMIFTALGRAAALATIPIAYAFGALTLVQLYLASFLIGTLSVLFYVSYSTLFVSLVPRERYLEASSLLNGSRAFSYVAGPSLGGVLVQVFSAPVALIVDAFSFVFSALTMHSIHPQEPPTEEAGRGHLKAGIRYIWDSPIVRAKLLSTATINFFNFVFWALFILYVTRELGVRPGVLGLVLGAGAFGGVLGSLVTGRLSRRFGVGPVMVAGSVLFPLPLVLVPLAGGGTWTVYACLFLAEFISGFGVMLLDISANAITSALVPDRLRARVAGAYMVVNYGVRPLGALAGGALGTWIGLRPTLWIATVGAIAGVLFLLPSPIPQLRELPEADE
ncbi:MAG TPA: MFS transporter [Gaiellaceae bacterium]|nr:MFS transporter [Gaiellaceae bacterium]